MIIPLAIWSSRCHILLWPNDLEAALKAAHFDDEDVVTMMEDDYKAATMLNSLNEPVIVVRKEVPRIELIGLFAHEAFHAASALLDVCDVPLTRKGHNEAHAYTLGFIVEEAVRMVDTPKAT